jgi:hypothetical protein
VFSPHGKYLNALHLYCELEGLGITRTTHQCGPTSLESCIREAIATPVCMLHQREIPPRLIFVTGHNLFGDKMEKSAIPILVDLTYATHGISVISSKRTMQSMVANVKETFEYHPADVLYELVDGVHKLALKIVREEGDQPD